MSEEVKIQTISTTNTYVTKSEGSGVGCGHHHRCRAGPLTIQVVDAFVPGGGILGYKVIDLLQKREAHRRAELRYTQRQTHLKYVLSQEVAARSFLM